MYGKKDTGANVEFLLLKRLEGDTWESIVRPGSKLKAGAKVIFGDGLLEATVLEVLDNGNRKVEFKYNGIFNEILDQIGLMPLPPYITEATREDNEKYQTVYAKYDGSAAAPTAGLHFTDDITDSIFHVCGIHFHHLTSQFLPKSSVDYFICAITCLTISAIAASSN